LCDVAVEAAPAGGDGTNAPRVHFSLVSLLHLELFFFQLADSALGLLVMLFACCETAPTGMAALAFARHFLL
jgi:hypothetical protein